MTPPEFTAHEALLEDDDWLRGLARALVRDPHRVDDVVQETLVAAWEHGRRTPGANGERPGRGWLGSVLRNFARQDARARGRRAAREERVARERPEGAGPPPSAALERLELRQELLAAVKSLEEPYQSAVALRFLDGLAPREVAKRTGVPVKTVHTHLERGLAKLRARLDRGAGDRSAWLGALVALAAGETSRWFVPTGLAAAAKTWLAIGALALAGGLVARSLAQRGEERTAPTLVAPSVPATSPDDASPDPAERVPVELDPADGPARAPLDRIEARAPVQPVAEPDSGPAGLAMVALDIVVRGASDGEPVGNAEIVLYRTDGWTRRPAGVQARLRTESNGRATTTVPADAPLLARVTVVDGWGSEHPFEDLRSAVDPIAPGGRGSVVLRLRHGRDAAFAGRVLDERGQPVPGVTVQRRPAEGSAVETDDEGRFALSCASWKAELAQLDHPDFAPAVIALEARSGAHAAEVVDVALARPAGLTATLFTSSSARHELLVRVDADELAHPRGLRVRGEPFTWRVALQVNAPAHLPGLPPGAKLAAEVYRDGELLLREVIAPGLEPGEDRAVEWRPDGLTAVSGVVLDDEGRPRADTELWILPAACTDGNDASGRLLHGDDVQEIARSVRTDGDGAFRVADLNPGCWWIGPALRAVAAGPERTTIAPWAMGFELLEGGAAHVLELRTHLGLWIEGRAVDASGTALFGSLSVQPVGGVGGFTERLDATGAFRVGPLAPGRYYLRPHALGTIAMSDTVVAAAGDRDVVVTVDVGNGIAGRVVDERGAPLDGHVTLVLDGGGSLGTTTGAGGEAGSFRFSELRPGRHVLTATAGERIAVREVLLDEGETVADLTLALAPGGRLQIALSGVHDRVRCAVLHEGVILEDFTLRQEGPTLQVVPPGHGLVLLYHGTWSERLVFAERAFEIGVGEQLELAFDLTR